MGPCDLTKALGQLAPVVDPRLLVGPDTLDDAAAIEVAGDLAICFTADFITPVVDDPADWGQIAAANSISDVYAMGARPLAALNLVCWPKTLDVDLLGDVLVGGARAATEAGCLIVGGHTIQDKEPKYGMAVIGTVHPDRVLRNRGAVPGDLLYLTKPLGTGILATALKREAADDDEAAAAIAVMRTLNRAASEAAQAAAARALTDVTGFGLAGHLAEMLGPAGELGVEMSMESLPVLPGVRGHIEAGMIPGGARRNRDAYADRVRVADGIDETLQMLLYDPQTSGGLLAAMAPENAELFQQEAAQRGVNVSRIGKFTRGVTIDVAR